MSFHYENISKQVLYKNRYFISKNNEGHYILSDLPSSDSLLHDVFWKESMPFAKIPCLDLEGNLFIIDDNFLSSTQLISHNQEKYILLYHVTMDDYLSIIKAEGLKPKIGLLSSELGEEKEQIYLFPNEEEMNTGLSNWMGDFYSDYCEENDIDFDEFLLHSLYVKIPISKIPYYLDESSVGYEVISSKLIPENLIHYHSEQ